MPEKRMGKAAGVAVVSFIFVLATTAVAAAVDMTLWVNSWPQAGVDAIQRAADLFASRHPEVTSVTVLPVPQGEHMERLTVNVIAGSPPDVVALAAPFAQPALARLLLPITRLIDQSDVIDRANYPPFMLSSLSFEGEEYGVPAIEARSDSCSSTIRTCSSRPGLRPRARDSGRALRDASNADADGLSGRTPPTSRNPSAGLDGRVLLPAHLGDGV